MINKIFDKPSFSLFNNYEFIDKLRKKVNDIIDVINSGGSDTGINYSTDEQKIGTWIDGSDLYQKSYNITIPESDETNLIGDDYLNIDTVTDIEVVVKMANEDETEFGNTFIQGIMSGTTVAGLSSSKLRAEFWSDSGLSFTSGSEWAGLNAVMTIKYIKKG